MPSVAVYQMKEIKNHPLLEIKNLSKQFPIESGIFKTRGFLHAVQNVSFSMHPGEIIGLVGESGSGKTTIGKMIQGLIEPTGGEILIEGTNVKNLARKERAEFVQMIFQDPFASLNPKLCVGTILSEAVQHHAYSNRQKITKEETVEIVKNLLKSVGMPDHILHDYPHQFSGGQRQRLMIARSLAMKPKLLIADEPVSALDLSIQAQILNLLTELNEKLNIAILLITHDLSIVEYLADRILVAQNGKIVEEGTTEKIFESPQELYTQKLFSAIPSLILK